MFPPHNDPTVNASHQVTITSIGLWTSVTVKLLKTDFTQLIFLSAHQSKTVQLPGSVEMTEARSSHLLSVTSIWPVTVLTSFCSQTGCDHSLLHDTSSWGNYYYPITPHFNNQTAVHQMVITSSDLATSVEIFAPGDMHFEGSIYPGGSVLKLLIGVRQSVCLQSNSSFSGSEINSQEAVGVVVGYTCSGQTRGDCIYGFAELKPVSHWGFDYAIPPLVNTGMSSSCLLAMSSINSDVDVVTSNGRESVSLIGGVMKVIPVVTSDKMHITSDSPLQLVYFRNDNAERPLTLTVLPSVDDICKMVPMFDLGDKSEEQNNSPRQRESNSDIFSQFPDNTEHSPYTDTDMGLYLSTMSKQLYPAVCEKGMYQESFFK